MRPLYLMHKLGLFIVIMFVIIACKRSTEIPAENLSTVSIKTEMYELVKPPEEAKAVLILFGGYPEVAEDIKREFNILPYSTKENLALIFSNFNQKIWLKPNEKAALANSIEMIFINHQLPKDNIYFGGFSSGGNIALLVSDYLMASSKQNIKPRGVFIIDSPIDLTALYKSAEVNIQHNISKSSVQEGKWLLKMLNNELGNPKEDIRSYEEHALFSSASGNIDNMANLKHTKIRLYTEPDTLWWQEYRMIKYNQMNAYYIKKLAQKLNTSGFKSVDYIPTTNKGYRADGVRHPHSWSIVDIDGLIDWMINE